MSNFNLTRAPRYPVRRRPTVIVDAPIEHRRPYVMQTIDLTTVEDDSRPSSPHDSKATAIVINSDDDDDNNDLKMPAFASTNMARVSMSPLASSVLMKQSSSPHLSERGAGRISMSPTMTSMSRTMTVIDSAAFPIGCKVIIHGIVSMPEMNGKTGIIRSGLNERGRQKVYIPGEYNKIYGISPANMMYESTMNETETSFGLSRLPSTATAAAGGGGSNSSHRQIIKTRRAEEKRRRAEEKRRRAEKKRSRQREGHVKSETNPSVKEEEGSALGGDGVVEEEAGEITYTKYRPSKFGYGKDHPDPVVENSTLGAVLPPDISFDMAMPPSIIYKGLLSNLQLEAIAYGCRRHEINLPSKPVEERNWMTHSMNEDIKMDIKVDDSLGTSSLGGGRKRDPVDIRAGFLLGDGAGMGKGRTLAGFVVENIARGRKKHVWISVSSDLYEDAKRDLSDLGLSTYANKHCYNLGKLPYGDLEETCSEGVMFATYQTLISKNKAKQTRLDQLIEWCGGDAFEGLIMLDECHKAKTIELDADGNPRTKGQGVNKEEKSSQTAMKVVKLQQLLPRARVVYCSATSVSHPKNLGFMSRLGLWGYGTEHPSG